jgi:hypothetical protein
MIVVCCCGDEFSLSKKEEIDAHAFCDWPEAGLKHDELPTLPTADTILGMTTPGDADAN